MVNAPDGTHMINPTATGGEEWYLYMGGDPLEDPRFNAVQVTGNGTDGFQTGEDFALMTVETSTGYNIGSIIQDIDHAFLASTGYMYKSNDWKDVEITGLFNCSLVPADKPARIQFMARGAELSEFKPWCPGTFYMGELTIDGQFRWTKSQYYLSYDSKEWLEPGDVGLGSNLRTLNWFGFKIVLSNIDIGLPGEGREGVRLRAFVDPANTSNWKEILQADIRDMGGWGKDGVECGGNSDQIVTWGGPIAAFGFHWGSKIKWNKLSIREVDAGGSFLEPAPTRQAPAFAAVSRVLTSTTHRYRIGTFIEPTCAGEVPTNPNPPPPGPGDPGGPPAGFLDVDKKIAHEYDIEKARTSIDSIDVIVRVIRSRAEARAEGDFVSVDVG
jgi:hypothetical protein